MKEITNLVPVYSLHFHPPLNHRVWHLAPSSGTSLTRLRALLAAWVSCPSTPAGDINNTRPHFTQNYPAGPNHLAQLSPSVKLLWQTRTHSKRNYFSRLFFYTHTPCRFPVHSSGTSCCSPDLSIRSPSFMLTSSCLITGHKSLILLALPPRRLGGPSLPFRDQDGSLNHVAYATNVVLSEVNGSLDSLSRPVQKV